MVTRLGQYIREKYEENVKLHSHKGERVYTECDFVLIVGGTIS
jgi:hypothetical protein